MTEGQLKSLWRDLVFRKHGINNAKPPLSIEERYYYAITLMLGIVSEDGFLPFFNHYSDHDPTIIDDAYNGLKELNLLNEAGLFDDARKIADRLTNQAGNPMDLEKIDAVFSKFEDDIWETIVEFGVQKNLQPRLTN